MRAPDLLWDALVDALGLEPSEITPRRRGKLNAALKELRAVHATPEEIHRRARAYRYKYPGAALSELALADHWSEFSRKKPALRVVESEPDQEPPRPSAREALSHIASIQRRLGV